jgi:hypothetical protein
VEYSVSWQLARYYDERTLSERYAVVLIVSLRRWALTWIHGAKDRPRHLNRADRPALGWGVHPARCERQIRRAAAFNRALAVGAKRAGLSPHGQDTPVSCQSAA